jgi:hypothetical protein
MAHPRQRQVKMQKPVLYGGMAKSKISIYIVQVFSKIIAFKGTIRNFLNMVKAHIEGLFNTLFSCHCPSGLLKVVLEFAKNQPQPTDNLPGLGLNSLKTQNARNNI